MKLPHLSTALVVLAACVAPARPADTLSPVGRWQTIDDKTTKPRSIVAVVMRGDTLVASIDSLYRQPGEEPDPICKKCTGIRKGLRVRGLVITDAMVKHGSQWSGGFIIDPESGKQYRGIIRVREGGRKLEVRGFIGISLVGRSQYWNRVADK